MMTRFIVSKKIHKNENPAKIPVLTESTVKATGITVLKTKKIKAKTPIIVIEPKTVKSFCASAEA